MEWLKGREPIDEVEQARHLQRRVAVLRQHLSPSAIPSTFIASLDGEPVGTASLVHYQFTSTQAPSEWLTNIYVVAECRARGIARKLIDHACAFAAEHGVSLLHLYTKDKGVFYLNLGWEFSGSANVQQEQVEIYSKRLLTPR